MWLAAILYNLTRRYTLIKILLCLEVIAILLLPEILLLFYLAQLYGKLLVLAIICITSLAGLYLVTNSIFHITKKIRLSINNGLFKEHEFGMLYALLLCGCLLILPGFITNIVGILLFIPPVRLVTAKILTKRLAVDMQRAYCYMKLYS